jgi:hypothetical protein
MLCGLRNVSDCFTNEASLRLTYEIKTIEIQGEAKGEIGYEQVISMAKLTFHIPFSYILLAPYILVVTFIPICLLL